MNTQPFGMSSGEGTSPFAILLRLAHAAERRRRGEQRLRIGMQRFAEDALLGSVLDGEAEIHHQHVVRDVLHHREIVRDEQIGKAELLLEVEQQIEHLRLHRNVQRRYRLIGDQQFRLQHQSPRNGDALALAAGKHMRIAPRMFGAQADAGHHRMRLGAPLGLAEVGVDDQRLFENLADGLARVERAIGILEHQLHRAAQSPGIRRHRARRRRRASNCRRPAFRSM